MIRTLALILLFVTCVFGAIGDFCAHDQHCGPGEKCQDDSTDNMSMKQCTHECASTTDCPWYLGYVCRDGRCDFVAG